MWCIYCVTKLWDKHRQCTVRGGGPFDGQALMSGRQTSFTPEGTTCGRYIKNLSGISQHCTCVVVYVAVAGFNLFAGSWHCVLLLIYWQQTLDAACGCALRLGRKCTSYRRRSLIGLQGARLRWWQYGISYPSRSQRNDKVRVYDSQERYISEKRTGSRAC